MFLNTELRHYRFDTVQPVSPTQTLAQKYQYFEIEF